MNSNNQLLPYNTHNTLIDRKQILELLSIYDSINNINIYRRAFVHRSYCTRKNENYYDGNVHCPHKCMPLQEESNERLEFLGDAVLNTTIGIYLFHRYPDENEGFLTMTRSKLVNGEMLARLAESISIGKHVIISQQIEINGGRNNKKILEDTFEAFIGAIVIDFGDEGFKKASDWIIHIMEEYVDFSDLMMQRNNYKDELVKYCQHNYQFVPKFFEIDIIENNGTKEHTVCVKNNIGVVVGIGKGNNKKQAESQAAKKALEYYQGA